MPQSYGFAGHILVVPADRVERIDADAAEVMAFIISGGVTQVESRRSHAAVSVTIRCRSRFAPSPMQGLGAFATRAFPRARG